MPAVISRLTLIHRSCAVSAFSLTATAVHAGNPIPLYSSQAAGARFNDEVWPPCRYIYAAARGRRRNHRELRRHRCLFIKSLAYIRIHARTNIHTHKPEITHHTYTALSAHDTFCAHERPTFRTTACHFGQLVERSVCRKENFVNCVQLCPCPKHELHTTTLT